MLTTDHQCTHDAARQMIRKAPTGCRFYAWVHMPALRKDDDIEYCATSISISRAAALKLVAELLTEPRKARGLTIGVTTYAPEGGTIEALYVG